MLETKAPVLINDVPAWEAERGEPMHVDVGEPVLSVLVAPLLSGEEFRGRISLQNVDRTNAFSENDVRLLTTLAGSLSVALENARLVHETRQRNAELALINGVQGAIAGELDPQSIYALVGDKLEAVDAVHIQKEGPKALKGNVRWAADRSKYFVAATRSSLVKMRVSSPLSPSFWLIL